MISNDGIHPTMISVAGPILDYFYQKVGSILLNDCPFCGLNGKPAFNTDNTGFRSMQFIICYECGAEGPRQSTHDLARQWWNGEHKICS